MLVMAAPRFAVLLAKDLSNFSLSLVRSLVDLVKLTVAFFAFI